MVTFDFEISSSPAQREKKGARPAEPKAKQDGIDEGTWPAKCPHLPVAHATGPLFSRFAEETKRRVHYSTIFQ